MAGFRPSDLVAALVSLRNNPVDGGLGSLPNPTKLQPLVAVAKANGVAAGALGGALGASAGMAKTSNGVDVDKILATIRSQESGGNYTVRNSSGAGGAYQFIDSTWKGLGGGKYAAQANQATAQQQDEIARAYVSSILDANGGDIRSVPGTWYVGGGAYSKNKDNPNYYPGGNNNGLTLGSYIDHWLKLYG